MFSKIRAFWRILREKPTQEIETPPKTIFGYEVVLKNKQTGQILFWGVVLDYELTDKNLWMALEDGDELGKLSITLTGDELIFIRELKDKIDFFSKEFILNSCRLTSLSNHVFWY